MYRRSSKQARSLVFFIVLCVALALTVTELFLPRRVVRANPAVVYKTYGLGFSPYVDGQDPNLGSQISIAQMTARLQIVANHTTWVRSFGCTHGLENFGMVAHSLG